MAQPKIKQANEKAATGERLRIQNKMLYINRQVLRLFDREFHSHKIHCHCNLADQNVGMFLHLSICRVTCCCEYCETAFCLT